MQATRCGPSPALTMQIQFQPIHSAGPDPYGLAAARAAREAHAEVQAAAPFGIKATRLRREAEAMEARSEFLRSREAKREASTRDYNAAYSAERMRVEINKGLSGAHALSLTRPSDIHKYRELAKSRSRSWNGGGAVARNVLAGLRKLEAQSGLDLDGDGDIGAPGAFSKYRGGHSDHGAMNTAFGHNHTPPAHWYSA